MKLQSFICCETALQDVRTNSLSLITVLEEVHAIAFPILLPKVSAVALFEREATEPDKQVARLTAHLQGQQIIDFQVDANFQGSTRTRVVAEVQGLPVNTPGDLIFSLSAGEPLSELAQWVIKVQAVGAPKVDLFTMAPQTDPRSRPKSTESA